MIRAVAAIRIVQGWGVGKRVEFGRGDTVCIGRAPELLPEEGSAVLAIDDPKVSRVHCAIREEGGSWILEDRGSSNGTYWNGKRMERAELSPGDRIRVGDVVLLFEETEDVGAQGGAEGLGGSEGRRGVRGLVIAAAIFAAGIGGILWFLGRPSEDSPGEKRAGQVRPAQGASAAGTSGRRAVGRAPGKRPSKTAETRGVVASSPEVEISPLLEKGDYRGAAGLLESLAKERPESEIAGARLRVLESVRSELSRVREEMERLIAEGDIDAAREIALGLILRLPPSMADAGTSLLRRLEEAGASLATPEIDRAEEESASKIEGAIEASAKLLADPAAEKEAFETLCSEMARILRETRHLRAYARKRSEFRKAYVEAKERVLKEKRKAEAFHATEVSWRGESVTLRYSFRSESELRDFRLLEGSGAFLRRSARGLSLRGECRLFEGEPFEGRILVRATIPRGGYEALAPSIGIALFVAGVDRLKPPDAKPRSILAPAFRPEAPGADFIVFLLGYTAVTAVYGERAFEELEVDGRADPVRLPAHAVLAGWRRLPLHSAPREGLWASELRGPLEGILKIEMELSETEISWTLNRSSLLPKDCPPCKRALSAASGPGTVTLFAPSGPVTFQSLEIEARVRETWLFQGVRQAAEASFDDLERSAEPGAEPQDSQGFRG